MANIPPSDGWKTDDWRSWIQHLLDQLRGHLIHLREDGKDASMHVHQSRRILKRLRTGTRLLRNVVGPDILKRNRLIFRDAARLLADSRDGTVRLQTFNDLLGSDDQEIRGELAKARLRLATEAEKGERKSGEGAEEALLLLDQVKIPDRMWGVAGKRRIKRNLSWLLTRARRDYRKVGCEECPEFHEFRKRLKNLLYSVEALPGAPKGPRKQAIATLKTLDDALGLQNDVYVLETWHKKHGYGPDVCPEFWEASTRRIEELRKVVMKEGKILDKLAKSSKHRETFGGG